MFNNEKMPLLVRVGSFISVLGYTFKQGGLKRTFEYIKFSIHNTIFVYKFRHFKKFRMKYLSNLTADNIGFIALVNMFYGGEEFSLRNCVKYLSAEEKEKFKKNTLESVQTTIKSNKITDEEQLSSILNMFGLDLLGVKVEDVMPKKTTKKRVKKDKVYSIPTSIVK